MYFLPFNCFATVLLFFNLLSFVVLLPLPKFTSFSNSKDPATSNVMDFMVKYGYLAAEDAQSGALRREDYFQNAIRKLQSYAKIPVTGIIDDETKKLIKKPRCGLPDVTLDDFSNRVRRFALKGSKWPKLDLTWTVISRPLYMDSHLLKHEITRALDLWGQHSKLTFKEVNSKKADILISFEKKNHGDNLNFDGPGGVLAHAFFPASDIGGDAHFDSDEYWTGINSKTERQDMVPLFGVAAHEFGHSLGLAHSDVNSSLMFPYFNKDIDYNYKLPQDDINGIQQLYGARYKVEWTPYTPPNRPDSERNQPRKNKDYQPDLPDSNIPSTCDTSFDAASFIRGEIFFFKGKYFWRLYGNKTLERNYPILISKFWTRLPSDFEKVDAVYERQSDRKIMFFIGKSYYIFNGNALEAGYPKKLTSLGLPKSLERIDAATTWGHNGKVYLFSGNQYWHFEEATNRVEETYPRDISIWKGIPSNLDAAFLWTTNGVTYFFKDRFFWEFDDRKMSVIQDSPKSSTHFWFESFCKNTPMPKAPLGEREPNSVDGSTPLFSSTITIITCIILSLSFATFG